MSTRDDPPDKRIAEMADYHMPTRAELVAALRSKADPGGCTQGTINGARVDCRTFHVNRIHRWCRTCLLLEAAEVIETAQKGVESR